MGLTSDQCGTLTELLVMVILAVCVTELFAQIHKLRNYGGYRDVASSGMMAGQIFMLFVPMFWSTWGFFNDGLGEAATRGIELLTFSALGIFAATILVKLLPKKDDRPQ